jgi:hypothetical protein
MKGRTAGHPFPENNDVSNSARPRPRYCAWHLLPGVLDNSLSAFIGVGRIAQLVEQLTLNQRVPGSSPGAPTNKFPTADAEITGRDERGLERPHPSRSSFRLDVKICLRIALESLPSLPGYQAVAWRRVSGRKYLRFRPRSGYLSPVKTARIARDWLASWRQRTIQ